MVVALSVECSKSGSYKLIGQFCRDVIGCKTQERKSVVIDLIPSVSKVRSLCSFHL